MAEESLDGTALGFPDFKPPEEMSKGAMYKAGFQTAETLFYENSEREDWINPFKVGTDQHRGFEEAVYIFTHK